MATLEQNFTEVVHKAFRQQTTILEKELLNLKYIDDNKFNEENLVNAINNLKNRSATGNEIQMLHDVMQQNLPLIKDRLHKASETESIKMSKYNDDINKLNELIKSSEENSDKRHQYQMNVDKLNQTKQNALDAKKERESFINQIQQSENESKRIEDMMKISMSQYIDIKGDNIGQGFFGEKLAELGNMVGVNTEKASGLMDFLGLQKVKQQMSSKLSKGFGNMVKTINNQLPEHMRNNEFVKKMNSDLTEANEQMIDGLNAQLGEINRQKSKSIESERKRLLARDVRGQELTETLAEFEEKEFGSRIKLLEDEKTKLKAEINEARASTDSMNLRDKQDEFNSQLIKQFDNLMDNMEAQVNLGVMTQGEMEIHSAKFKQKMNESINAFEDQVAAIETGTQSIETLDIEDIITKNMDIEATMTQTENEIFDLSDENTEEQLLIIADLINEQIELDKNIAAEEALALQESIDIQRKQTELSQQGLDNSEESARLSLLKEKNTGEIGSTKAPVGDKDGEKEEGGFFSGIFDKLKYFIGVIPVIVAGIGTALTTAAAAVGTFITATLIPILPIIAGVAIAIGALYALWDGFSNKSEEWYGENASFAEKMSSMFGHIVSILTFGLVDGKAAADAFLGAFGDLFSAIGDFISTLYNAFLPIIDSIGQIIGGIIDVVVAPFKAIFHLLTGDFEAFWNDIKQFFSGITEIFAGIGNLFTNIGTLIWDAFTGIINILFEAIISIPKAIFNAAIALPGLLWDAMTFVADAIIDAVMAIPKLVIDAISAIPTMLYDGVMGIFDGISTWISDALTGFSIMGYHPFASDEEVEKLEKKKSDEIAAKTEEDKTKEETEKLQDTRANSKDRELKQKMVDTGTWVDEWGDDGIDIKKLKSMLDNGEIQPEDLKSLVKDFGSGATLDQDDAKEVMKLLSDFNKEKIANISSKKEDTKKEATKKEAIDVKNTKAPKLNDVKKVTSGSFDNSDEMIKDPGRKVVRLNINGTEIYLTNKQYDEYERLEKADSDPFDDTDVHYDFLNEILKSQNGKRSDKPSNTSQQPSNIDSPTNTENSTAMGDEGVKISELTKMEVQALKTMPGLLKTGDDKKDAQNFMKMTGAVDNERIEMDKVGLDTSTPTLREALMPEHMTLDQQISEPVEVKHENMMIEPAVNATKELARENVKATQQKQNIVVSNNTSKEEKANPAGASIGNMGLMLVNQGVI